MRFSNAFLMSLLIAAIIFSLFSFFFVLGSFGSLSHTGFNVKDVKEGSISLSIIEYTAITTADSPAIDFRNCELLPGEYFIISSDGANETFKSCFGYEVSNISVRNSGTLPVEVWVSSNHVGELYGGDLLPSPSNNLSDVAYRVTNAGRAGNKGGCLGDFPDDFKSFNETYPSDFLVCDYLNKDILGGNNSVVVDFRFVIPEDVELGVTDLNIVFSAMAVI